MVDRDARDKLAELLRHLASGTINVEEFGSRAPRESDDEAIRSGWSIFRGAIYELLNSVDDATLVSGDWLRSTLTLDPSAQR